MSVARTWGVSLAGISGTIIEIEADVGAQLPRFVIVGLGDRSLGEAEDRVRQASANSGVALPSRRLTVNLAPAQLPKHGSAFDLGIAVAAMAAGGHIHDDTIGQTIHIGELGLDGRIRRTPGTLPSVRAAYLAGFRRIVVSQSCVAEAELASGDAEIIGVETLRDLAVKYGANVEAANSDAASIQDPTLHYQAREHGQKVLDFSDVQGQGDAVTAAEIAAAGAHNMLLVGPPGAGKTMIAERLPTIMPPLDDDQAIEATSIASIDTDQHICGLIRTPPFQAPHHSSSATALLGGGNKRVAIGAVTRAHRGVLFLDESPEFARHVMNGLREPLESGRIVIMRAGTSVTLPARFQLILASNPCPCGQYGSQEVDCGCTPDALRRYRLRLSGPIMDRVDIQLRVHPVNRIGTSQKKRSSGVLLSRVVTARSIARERWKEHGFPTNSEVPGALLRGSQYSAAASDRASLDRALSRGSISMRGYDRILRLAWTISDLDEGKTPTASHIDQAVYFRKAAS